MTTHSNQPPVTNLAIAFSNAIAELRDAYGIPAEEINRGYCADFATVMCEQWTEAKVLSDEDFGRPYTHTFLKYREHYYDAETVNGVTNWRDLPIFARQKTEQASQIHYD